MGTLAALKDRCRTILASLVAEHEGCIVNVMGDGRWRGAEFCSAINAVVSAGEYQQRIAEPATALPTIIQ